MQSRPIDGGWVLKLELGESVPESVTAFCTRQGVEAGHFHGIGALLRARLGYFDMERRTYDQRAFEGPFEVLSVSGNIGRKSDGSLFAHTHCVLGDREFRAIGGHLFEGEVGATMELVLLRQEGTLQRGPDPVTGLELLDLE
jgi:predicted DNA-binding protein with PD1-like motif